MEDDHARSPTRGKMVFPEEPTELSLNYEQFNSQLSDWLVITFFGLTLGSVMTWFFLSLLKRPKINREESYRGSDSPRWERCRLNFIEKYFFERIFICDFVCNIINNFFSKFVNSIHIQTWFSPVFTTQNITKFCQNLQSITKNNV